MVLMCSHAENACRDYAPVWEELAKQVHPVLKVGTLDCSVRENSQICGRHARHNSAVPTILRVGTSEAQGTGKFALFKTLKRKKQQNRDTRQRAEQLARFAYSALPTQPQLHNVRTEQHLGQFLRECRATCGESKHEKCECALIFSTKYETTPAAKAVAAHLSTSTSTDTGADTGAGAGAGRTSRKGATKTGRSKGASRRGNRRGVVVVGGVGEVRASGPAHRLAQRFGVRSHPAVLLVDAGTGAVVTRSHHAPKGAAAILEFIQSHSTNKITLQ